MLLKIKKNAYNAEKIPSTQQFQQPSLFQAYIPVCPRGYNDCVCDPAYTLYHSPQWYNELYGQIPPEQVILTEGGCMERYKDGPEEEGYCYDDGD